MIGKGGNKNARGVVCPGQQPGNAGRNNMRGLRSKPQHHGGSPIRLPS